MPSENVSILVSPAITPDQLFAFYVENDVCEQGVGRDIALNQGSVECIIDHRPYVTGSSD